MTTLPVIQLGIVIIFPHLCCGYSPPVFTLHYTNGYPPVAEAGDDQISHFLALDDAQQVPKRSRYFEESS